MTILAIDPGGVTGIALWYPTGGYVGGEVADAFTGMHAWLHGDGVYGLDWDEVTQVVIESFIINATTHKKSPVAIYETLDILGMVRAECKTRDIALYRQSPAEAKGFGTDEKLRRLGWHVPTKGGHRNDAARHLVTFLGAHLREPSILRQLTSA